MISRFLSSSQPTAARISWSRKALLLDTAVTRDLVIGSGEKNKRQPIQGFHSSLKSFEMVVS